jgi:hypothetical protein
MKAYVATALLFLAGCSGAPAPVASPSPATAARPSRTIYQRLPDTVAAYHLTERGVVRGAPTDSVYRFSDGTRTYVSVFIYDIPSDVKIGPDSQKWTFREGEKFKLVQQIRRQQGLISDFSEPVSDSTRMTLGGRPILEHAMIIPTRYNNGAVTVEYQILYQIDGRLLKVRGTVPAEDFTKSTVHAFAKQLATIVAQP